MEHLRDSWWKEFRYKHESIQYWIILNILKLKDIPKYFENSVLFYSKENASPASNRVVINRNPQSSDFKTPVHVYYLEDNKTELFKKFEFSNQLSKSTFMKFLNQERIFKKPFRLATTV